MTRFGHSHNQIATPGKRRIAFASSSSSLSSRPHWKLSVSDRYPSCCSCCSWPASDFIFEDIFTGPACCSRWLLPQAHASYRRHPLARMARLESLAGLSTLGCGDPGPALDREWPGNTPPLFPASLSCHVRRLSNPRRPYFSHSVERVLGQTNVRLAAAHTD